LNWAATIERAVPEDGSEKTVVVHSIVLDLERALKFGV
jgi:hypothetical protein